MPRRSPANAARTRLAAGAAVALVVVVGAAMVVLPRVATATASVFPALASPTTDTTTSPSNAATDAPSSTATATATPAPTAAPTPTTPTTPTPTASASPTAPATPTPTTAPTQPGTGAINATSLTGRVTDQATGEPLAGVSVYIYTSTGGYGTAIPITTTDADGGYTFYSLDVRSYTLNFVANGYRGEWFGGGAGQSDAATFAVALGEGVTGKDASLLPLDSISGTVSAGGSAKQAVAGATVSAFGTDGTLYGSATTTDDGGYAIAGLKPGTYTLRVAPPRESTLVAQWLHDKTHPTSPAVIKLEVDTAVNGTNVALAAGAAVTGRITDSVSGAAIAGAWVYAYATTTATGTSGGSIASAQANANGDYTLAGLAAGSYTLQFSGGSAYGSDGYLREWWGNKSSRSGAISFTLQAGKTNGAVDAALVPTASISGAVYAAGARNVGLNLATVSAIDADGHVVRSVTTNGSGEYTLTGLEPGKYSLRFTPPVGTSFTSTWWHDPAKPSVHGVIRVTAGEVVSGKTAELVTASAR